MTKREERAALAAALRRAADALERDGLHAIRLLDARHIALAALDDIDRLRRYGNPGAALDELLGKKDGE